MGTGALRIEEQLLVEAEQVSRHAHRAYGGVPCASSPFSPSLLVFLRDGARLKQLARLAQHAQRLARQPFQRAQVQQQVFRLARQQPPRS